MERKPKKTTKKTTTTTTSSTTTTTTKKPRNTKKSTAPKKVTTPKKKGSLKIGITSGLKNNKESIWTNGIKQNILMLTHMLKNSEENYEIVILNVNNVDFTEKPKYLDDIDIKFFDDSYLDVDLLIVMGAQIHNYQIENFKKSGKNKKIISYKCGNNYVITMENILFRGNNPDSHYQFDEKYDEIWYVPQQDDVNSGYYRTLYRTNSLIVPFVWHHKFLLESVKVIESNFKKGVLNKSWKYEMGKEKKSLGIMEPNINIVKFCLIPSLIAEECYRGEIGKKYIDKLYISNLDELKNNKEFLAQIGTFDLYKDKKISAESRYQTSYILTQFFDILICHQILNPLNYLYLDAVFLGYPVLHNAPLCKDLGYYYEGSDTIESSKMLEYILTEHDKNIEAYDERNDKVLQRYHADNMEIVKTYDKLIENLFNGGNHGLKYNPNTNLYDNL